MLRSFLRWFSIFSWTMSRGEGIPSKRDGRVSVIIVCHIPRHVRVVASAQQHRQVVLSPFSHCSAPSVFCECEANRYRNDNKLKRWVRGGGGGGRSAQRPCRMHACAVELFVRMYFLVVCRDAYHDRSGILLAQTVQTKRNYVISIANVVVMPVLFYNAVCSSSA